VGRDTGRDEDGWRCWRGQGRLAVSGCARFLRLAPASGFGVNTMVGERDEPAADPPRGVCQCGRRFFGHVLISFGSVITQFL
jgi:hypothetical protein